MQFEEKGNEGAYMASLCGEVGGEVICERTDSWSRTEESSGNSLDLEQLF